MYTRISDKVVGILLRAKKYGLLYFEPEMLFQVEGIVFVWFKVWFIGISC